MGLKRKYKLNMPQLLWGGLSENWLLKELGDMHWQQITSALNTASDQLTDSRGERLYASFVRLSWSGANIADFKENAALDLQSSLSRYGSKMFFSETEGKGETGVFKANLMSVFSTREASDNTKLKKGTLKSEIDTDTVILHEKLPLVAKEYLENKSEIFDENNQLKTEAVSSFLYQHEYIIDAYDDINGVGLLYFASYPKINDKCEREYIKEHYELDKDWLELAGVVSRDIHYYGNANSGDKLIYELNSLVQDDNKVILQSSLYRVKDLQLIAKVYTVKQLSNGASFKKKDSIKTQKQELFSKNAKQVIKNENSYQESRALTNLDQKILNKVVIDFLESILNVKNLTKDTKLSELGIESIMYQELSEHLYDTYQIDSNPSRFYGAASVEAVTNYLLGKEEETKTSVKHFGDLEQEDIAIVGISGRFPGAINKEEFWNQIKENKNLITEVSEDRWDWKTFNENPAKTNKSRWGGFIEGVGNFDPLFFGISPFEAELMDPQQRITLEAVYTALEDANIVPSTLKGTNTGVYIGVSGSDYTHITREARKETVQAYDAIGTASSILANRISFLLDIHGPSQAIDTACSSSLVAVDQAVKSIKNKISDVAIVGGVHTMLRPELTISYHEAGMLSVDGKCKTFDNKANGYVRGEGVGIIVLKSLKKAKEDGNYIYGIIKGSAVNHGGKANTLTSPNPQAQKALLIEAYASANVKPSEVTYIEAHGTGTPLGDPIEIEGLKLAFEELYEHYKIPTETNYCGLGSVKTNIGHLEAGAGIAGLIKVLMCMKYKTLPGNPNLHTQNKYIDVATSPFYLRKETSSWEVKDKKRIAGVSSFGFGGVNAHVVLEEYENTNKVYKSIDSALIVLSAKNKERLKAKVSELKKFLKHNVTINIYDLAYTLQYGREEMEERLAFSSSNLQEIIHKLEAHELGNYNEISTGNSRKDNAEFLFEGEVGEAYKNIVLSKKDHNLLAQLWTRGISFDWSFLYGNNTPNKISLPTYPFAKQYYWVSKTTNTESSEAIKLATETTSTTEVFIEMSVEEKVETYLMSLLKKVLKLDEKDIDFTVDIADYGIDSIMSSIMISDLQEIIPDVPPLLFLEYKTFNDVVNYLVEDFSNKFNQLYKNELVSVKNEVSSVNKISTVQISEVTNLERVIETKTKEEIVEIKFEANESENKKVKEDIAIIGINAMLPHANTLLQFYEHLEKGNILTEKIPQRRKELLGLNEEESKLIENFHGAFIDDIEYFDYKKFKFTVEEAVQIDPQLRKLIESVWYAIGDSGYTIKDFNKKETGVFVATKGNSGYLEVMQKDDKPYEAETPTLYANRLSHVFNLRGPSEVIDTACSSFIVAIQKAAQALERGDCKQAVVATATLNLSLYDLIKEDLTGIYSKSGETKSFSENADGFVRSEALGSIIVKPLTQAEKDGDYIYGVVKGVGVYHGGKAPLKWNSPNIKGQKKAIEKALEQAEINPLSVDYIEAEANGVSFVDTSEMVSIQNIYGSYFSDENYSLKNKTIHIGSLKPLMGHAEASSTFPCLLKLLGSIKNEKLYGVKGLELVNKGIKEEQNFSILKEDIKWLSEENRRAAINCLGIGGVNTHLILEEYQNKTDENTLQKEFVFVFSEESSNQLQFLLEQFLESLTELKSSLQEPELLSRLSYTLQNGREYETCRLVIITDTIESLLSYIKGWLTNQEEWSNNSQKFYNSGITTVLTKEEIQEALQQKDYKQLAVYWVNGGTINWREIFKDVVPKRVPVPTTSLKKSICWPHEVSLNLNNKKRVVAPIKKTKMPLYNLIDGQTGSPYTLNDKHLFLFNLKWKNVFIDEALTIDTETKKHAILCYINNKVPKNYEGFSIEKAVDSNEDSFTDLVNSIFLYIQNRIKEKPRHTVVIQIVLPKSCIHNCYGLTGLIHTTRQESTKIKTQLIFVDDDSIQQTVIEKVLEKTLAIIDESRIVKYENTNYFVEYATPVNVLNHPIEYEETYKNDDVILITGGLGGLGVEVAKDILAYSKDATIILVGRSDLNEEKKKVLKTLNQEATNIVYYQADISNKKEVQRLISKVVETHKKLDGIIHCAGVIRDSYIMKKTIEEIEAVFQPKVNGAEYLDEATKNIALRFFLCFSSLHSLGNPGQADYAMANAYLDGFIRKRTIAVNEGKRFGTSITMNWPYWKSGGMQLSETAIDLMRMTKGSEPMPTEIGTEIMHYAIQGKIEQIFVDMGDYEKIVKQHHISINQEVLA